MSDDRPTNQTPLHPAPADHCEPVHYLSSDLGKRPEEGVALCLSGGGYRAMLFHAGVFWCLNDNGLLGKLSRISSVSGGSIAAGLLALNWKKLKIQDGIALNFKEAIVAPLQEMASVTIDVPSVIKGALWFGTIGDRLADAYRDHLFGDATLQDITPIPRFVFNATNLQSGVLWRFSRPYMRDYRVGEIKDPTTPLAVVVAASSALPPILSPVTLDLDPKHFTPDSGTDLQSDSYRSRVILSDGGVYDNLGLETAWKRYKTILVSDAGAAFGATPTLPGDWIRQTLRVLFTIDNQVRSLRKRQVVESFKAKIRKGAYWSITNDQATDHPVETALRCDFSKTSELACISTRLKRLTPAIQKRLINWGYAVCDSALRKHYDSSLSPAKGFPFPDILM